MSHRPVEVDELELTVADVAENVRKLKAKLPQLEDLSDSRAPRARFIPADTLQVMGEQYLKDRKARLAAMAAGHSGFVSASAAPGNLAAWSLEAEIALTLHHLVFRILRHHARASYVLDIRTERRGTERRRVVYRHNPATEDPKLVDVHLAPAAAAGIDVVLGPPPGDRADSYQVAGYLYELLWTVDSIGLVRATASEINHLLTTVTYFLEGEDRRAFGECPFCDQPSLVLYEESQVVRCERSRGRDGKRPPCRCAYAQCPCHLDPDFVHHWSMQRPPQARDSFQTLENQLTAARRIKETR